MFIFGHIGITLGIFYSLDHLFPEKNFRFDYQLVAFGSLCPDFIDKPLGRIILAETIGSGRIFAHTLLFVILLGLAGYLVYRRKLYSLPLVLAGASFCHLLEDRIWNSPEVLFWPLFGWGFPQDTIYGNFLEYFMVILGRAYDPVYAGVFASEIIGLGITLLFTASYVRLKMKSSKLMKKNGFLIK
ncbi:metal-dependent hydrolase [Methanosarcina sp. KYL-1]|uniref:metal-dependent hydrolase n=1 Tax=Methanosarcina sp. KYL-1 TaxID=2602068 RepID=UPI002101BCBC|nr:metal-dependent hydrolase [Methanosarcina sp. KYL-1]MCQ1535116.1 metal-dependent hydrolase [Methanosarcina sp. KYL-1]